MKMIETIKENTLWLIGAVIITIPLIVCYPILLYIGLSVKIATIITVCLSIIAYILLVTRIEPLLGRILPFLSLKTQEESAWEELELRNIDTQKAQSLNSLFFSTANIGNLRDYCIMQSDVKIIRLFDVVALTHDLPEHNLRRGQVGTVVEILSNDDAYEVEFSDRDGRTYQSLGFRAPQLMVLHHEPVKNPSNPISE